MATLLTLVLPDFVVDVERRWEGVAPDVPLVVGGSADGPGAGRGGLPCRASGGGPARTVTARRRPPRAAGALRARHSRPLRRGDLDAGRTRPALVRGGGLGRHRPRRHSRYRREEGIAGRGGRRDAACDSRRTRPRICCGHCRHGSRGQRRRCPRRTFGPAAGAAGVRRALPRAARPALAAGADGRGSRTARRAWRDDHRCTGGAGAARGGGRDWRGMGHRMAIGACRGASRARQHDPAAQPHARAAAAPAREFRGRATRGRAPGRSARAAPHPDRRLRALRSASASWVSTSDSAGAA